MPATAYRLSRDAVSEPGGSLLEVALFGKAGRAASGCEVAGAGTGPVAGHLQQMRADRVEALGGTIGIDSPPGDGTSVVVTLPLEPDGAIGRTQPRE